MQMSTLNLQPTTLFNDWVTLLPLTENDFETLYNVACDPLIWEQHPNKDRYKREMFAVFFEGAIQSKGAFKILDTKTGNTIGCSRFYDYNEADCSIVIGYTFFARSHWGKGYNLETKALMIAHAFTFADIIIFHVGSKNIRSQKAIVKIGAAKVGEAEVTYHGEKSTLNFIYAVAKNEWHRQIKENGIDN